MKKTKKKIYEMGGTIDNQGQQTGQNIGQFAGLALSLAGIPGLSPILGQVGSQVGGKIDMTKALQDHFASLSQSSNPYGNYAHGGEISGLDGLIKYNGQSHGEGGIQVDSKGVPSSNAVAEVEDGEVTMRSGTKAYVFSNKLKI